MRVLSLSLGLLASASLTLSSKCKPRPLTFDLMGANSGNPTVDGTNLGNLGDDSPLTFGLLPVQGFTLEAGTNYLMVDGGSLYIAWEAADNGLYPTDASQVTSAMGCYYVVCNPPVVSGVALSCAVTGYTSDTITQPFIGTLAGTANSVLMGDPSNLPSGAVPVDLVPNNLS